mmetsp:Transcript_21075/g.52750  ORF Transcript_21075/g.52750 Transcript_21075/m.52750 type:complete len:244 (+) Transcript_21075:662-1393(+)
MAAVQLHGVIDPSQALLRKLVTGVSNPAVSLHKDSRAKVVLWVPPIRRARGHAACTQDALVHAVELRAILPALEVLCLALLLDVLALQPGLNRLVLIVEVGEVRDEVLDDVRVRQGLDLNGLRAWLDVQQASQAILAIDVHRTRTTNALSAGAAEGERGVDLVLDLDESVQDHGPARLQVDGVLLQEGLRHLVRVVAVDAELLRRGRSSSEGPRLGRRKHGGPERRHRRVQHGNLWRFPYPCG